MLEALQDIEIASKLVGFDSDNDESLDDKYMKLHCNITPLAHDSEDYKLVEQYLLNTHAPTHKVWSGFLFIYVEICSCFLSCFWVLCQSFFFLISFWIYRTGRWNWRKFFHSIEMENLINTQDIKIICITRCYYGTVSIKAITSINKEKYISYSLQCTIIAMV